MHLETSAKTWLKSSLYSCAIEEDCGMQAHVEILLRSIRSGGPMAMKWLKWQRYSDIMISYDIMKFSTCRRKHEPLVKRCNPAISQASLVSLDTTTPRVDPWQTLVGWLRRRSCQMNPNSDNLLPNWTSTIRQHLGLWIRITQVDRPTDDCDPAALVWHLTLEALAWVVGLNGSVQGMPSKCPCPDKRGVRGQSTVSFPSLGWLKDFELSSEPDEQQKIWKQTLDVHNSSRQSQNPCGRAGAHHVCSRTRTVGTLTLMEAVREAHRKKISSRCIKKPCSFLSEFQNVATFREHA